MRNQYMKFRFRWKAVCTVLGIKNTTTHLEAWAKMVDRYYHPKKNVTIALVGKYIELHDAYLSVVESLTHGGIHNEAAVTVDWVDAETIADDKTAEKRLGNADGIIVPGGFGDRGIEGMIRAAKFARLHNIPYFGICLGMQIEVIEFARNVLHLENANSTEMNKTTLYPVIDLMPDQNGVILGGTLRLGKYECRVTPGTLTAQAYGTEVIWERHRHRYEFNNKFRDQFRKAGLVIAGINPERDLVEICEVPNHPWMLGVQFHPEFKSRPNRAHPLFREFVNAACNYRESKDDGAAL
jgi:CTP synthase